MSSTLIFAHAKKAQEPRAPRPLPQGVPDFGKRYSLAQQIHYLVLATEGFSLDNILIKTGLLKRTQKRIVDTAIERGYRPAEDPRILESYVVDGARSGRPREIDKDKKEEILMNVRVDRSSREKSSKVLTYEINISSISTLRVFYKHNFSNVKPTQKPSLNIAQKAVYFKFAFKYKDWTLKN